MKLFSRISLLVVLFCSFIEAKEVWFLPNAEKFLVPNRIKEVFGEEGRKTLADTASAWDVFGFHLYGLTEVEEKDLKAFSVLFKNKKTAVEVPGLEPWGCTGEISALHHLNAFKRLYQSGHALDYVAIDGLIWRVLEKSGLPENNCHYTVEKAVAETAIYAKKLKNALAELDPSAPEVVFGFVLNTPNERILGTPCFHANKGISCSTVGHGDREILGSENNPGILELLVRALRKADIKVGFLHSDNPFEYLDTHPGVSDVFKTRVGALSMYARSHDLRFAQIFNSEARLTPSEQLKPNHDFIQDKRFYDNTVSHIARFRQSEVLADDSVFHSWYPHPHYFGPVSRPYSLGWDILQLKNKL